MKHHLIDAIFHQTNKYSYELLLDEEMKAERRIAVIRLILLGFLFVIAVIESFIVKAGFLLYTAPFLIGLIMSVGFLVEISYMIKKKDKFRTMKKFYKYMVITADTIFLKISILHVFKIIGNTDINFTPGSSHFTIDNTYFAFLLYTSCITIIVINIFRFSYSSSIYTGIISIISTLTFYSFYSEGAFFNYQDYFSESIRGFYIVSIFLLSSLSVLISIFFRGVVLRSRRQEQLKRFLPEELAKEVLTGERSLDVGGKRRRVTILFSDIRNFTTMSESAAPEEVVDFLNSYFNDMIGIIFRYKGSLDKIIGDGIMAIYGMTEDENSGAEQAVLTARDMIEKLNDFNTLREIGGKPKIAIGIGIHTGDAILGYVGSNQRMDFTAIGDTVNTASRLESFSKTVEASIILSEDVVQELPSTISCKAIGEASLKGKEKTINAYTLV